MLFNFVKVFIKKLWWRRILFAAVGALLGFTYYSFIGCYGGSCPLTGNPYMMTGYGAIVGILLAQKQ